MFIPSDNLSIVLLLIPGLIDDSEDIINEIQRGFELDRNSLMKMYDILDEDGDVLRFIQLLNINNGNPEGI